MKREMSMRKTNRKLDLAARNVPRLSGVRFQIRLYCGAAGGQSEYSLPTVDVALCTHLFDIEKQECCEQDNKRQYGAEDEAQPEREVRCDILVQLVCWICLLPEHRLGVYEVQDALGDIEVALANPVPYPQQLALEDNTVGEKCV